MEFRRQSGSEVSLNLTPLIDVVFLLLIFFMVSTTFTKETHLTLDLPEASGEKLEEKVKQIEITISADGRYAINGRSLVNNQLDIIMKALEEESGGDYALPMIITADANTTHQAVITVMDAAGRMGFSKLSLTTQEPGKE